MPTNFDFSEVLTAGEETIKIEGDLILEPGYATAVKDGKLVLQGVVAHLIANESVSVQFVPIPSFAPATPNPLVGAVPEMTAKADPNRAADSVGSDTPSGRINPSAPPSAQMVPTSSQPNVPVETLTDTEISAQGV